MYNIGEFEKLVEEGYLRKSEKDDMVLYGYTDKTTFDRNWNEYTRAARGLILSKSTGEVIAKPFPKFFNMNEMEETQFKNLPLDKPYLSFEKVDGSLGIIFHHNGEWQISTRGSFYSEQAQRGKEILKKYDLSQLDTDTTLLAEIIYPENKIIVNYGAKEELVLLAAYNRVTEKEYDPMVMQAMTYILNMPVATVYYHKIEDMIAMQDTMPKDQEGFVVRFENGLRVKIKGFEYLMIARLLARISPLALWENMLGGRVNREYIQQLPEEFQKEYEPIAQDLESQYDRMMRDIQVDVTKLPTVYLDGESRKRIGLFIQDPKSGLKHPHVMFAFVQRKFDMVEKYIMKQLRPTGNVMKDIE